MANKFKVGDQVIWSKRGNKKNAGSLAGKVMGYYQDGFPILLLDEETEDGQLAMVYYDSVLDLVKDTKKKVRV